MASQVVPIVLCGGSGSRLWPLSRLALPKQFLPLVSERTMLQDTVARLAGVPDLQPPVVVCSLEHRFLVAEQLREIGVAPRAIVLEPAGRNTAPAVAAALLALGKDAQDAVAVVLPSDHLIGDIARFHAALAAAIDAARAGRLVTFGVLPDSPHTGYGYIRRATTASSELYGVARIAAITNRTFDQPIFIGACPCNGAIPCARTRMRSQVRQARACHANRRSHSIPIYVAEA